MRISSCLIVNATDNRCSLINDGCRSLVDEGYLHRILRQITFQYASDTLLRCWCNKETWFRQSEVLKRFSCRKENDTRFCFFISILKYDVLQIVVKRTYFNEFHRNKWRISFVNTSGILFGLHLFSHQSDGMQLVTADLFLYLANTWLQLHTSASLCASYLQSQPYRSSDSLVNDSKNKCNMKCGASLLNLRHTARMNKWFL